MSRPENKNYANGKATIVAYAMAMLEYQTMGKFDLLKVWQNQGISDNTKIYLNKLCDKLYEFLDERARTSITSILSYGKTLRAYEFIKSQSLDIDIHLLDNDLL